MAAADKADAALWIPPAAVARDRHGLTEWRSERYPPASARLPGLF
jgi:hypothetical protein